MFSFHRTRRLYSENCSAKGSHQEDSEGNNLNLDTFTCKYQDPSYNGLRNKYISCFKVWRLKFLVLRQWLMTFSRTEACSVFLFFILLVLRHIISHGYGSFKHYHTTVCKPEWKVADLLAVFVRDYTFPRLPHTLSHISLAPCPLKSVVIDGNGIWCLALASLISGPGNWGEAYLP